MKTYKEYLGESQLSEAKVPQVDSELSKVVAHVETALKMMEKLHTNVRRVPKGGYEDYNATEKVTFTMQADLSDCLDKALKLMKDGKSSGATTK
jgi:hypothetical protein